MQVIVRIIVIIAVLSMLIFAASERLFPGESSNGVTDTTF